MRLRLRRRDYGGKMKTSATVSNRVESPPSWLQRNKTDVITLGLFFAFLLWTALSIALAVYERSPHRGFLMFCSPILLVCAFVFVGIVYKTCRDIARAITETKQRG